MGKFSWAQELPITWISGGTTCTLTMDDHYFYALTVSVAEGQDGIMADYTETAPAPWHEYVTDIHTLVIEEGVKEIGKWAFIQFNINSVTLPQSLRVIKTDAFRNSTMSTIDIPSTVTYIEAGAFHYCEQLYDVFCYAKAEDILWGGSNLDFITGEGTGSYPYPRTTKMHVFPTRVAAFQSKYDTSLNVTFTAENMAPTDSWTDAGNYAESFSSAEGNTINIQNEAELARLAYLLNSGEQSFDQNGVINLANQGSIQIALSQVVEHGRSVETPTRKQDGSSPLQQAQGSGTLTIDNAIVSFSEGTALPKFRLGDNAEIYIPQGNEDYAIAYSDKQGEMPLNFKANEDGEYALSFNLEGVEMDYLHLIDQMTGADIDLLQAPSYSFTATTQDDESRFKLVFAAN